MIQGLEDGFCFTVRLLDGKSTKLFVNVVGHSEIGLPQTKGGNVIAPEVLDKQGIDNLQIPIDVSELTREPSEKDPKVEVGYVDVIVCTAVTQRCVRTHHFYPHFTTRLAALALHWVAQETGCRGDPTTVKVLQNVRRKYGRKFREKEAVHRRAQAMYEDMVKKQEVCDKEVEDEASKLPDHFNLRKNPSPSASAAAASNLPASCILPTRESDDKKCSSSSGKENSSSKADTCNRGEIKLPERLSEGKKEESTAAPIPTPDAAPKKKPLIVELDGKGNEPAAKKETVVKRGFLMQQDRPSLYPEGTKEGVLPDGAGDPLGYLPKSFRERCQVVDCRGDDGDKVMRQHVEESAAGKTGTNTGTGNPVSASTGTTSTTTTPPDTAAENAAVLEAGPAGAIGTPDSDDEDNFLDNWKKTKKANTPAGTRGKGKEFDFFGDGDLYDAKNSSTPGTVEAPSPTEKSGRAIPSNGPHVCGEPAAPAVSHVTNGIAIVETNSSVDDVMEELGFASPAKWPVEVRHEVDLGIVIVQVKVPPHITSVASLDLTIDEQSIEIAEEGGQAGSLRVALPQAICPDAASAKLLKKSRTLKVTAPVN